MTFSTKRGDSGRTDLAQGQRLSKSHPRIQALGELDELNAWLGVIVAYLKAASANCAGLQNCAGSQSGGKPSDSKLPNPNNLNNKVAAGLPQFLQHIQQGLFKIGAELAGYEARESQEVQAPWQPKQSQQPKQDPARKDQAQSVQSLDKLLSKIEAQSQELEAALAQAGVSLNHFVLPGGSQLAAWVDVARTVCRRAERSLVALDSKIEEQGTKKESQAHKSKRTATSNRPPGGHTAGANPNRQKLDLDQNKQNSHHAVKTAKPIKPLILQIINRLSDYLYLLRCYLNTLNTEICESNPLPCPESAH